MNIGRPSEYNETILQRTQEYMESYEQVGDAIPSVAGLAVFLEVSRKTIYNWADAHPEFLHILDQLLAKQEKTLFDKGLKNEFNSTITKLALGKHGYSEKLETDNKHEVLATITGMRIINDGDRDRIQNKESEAS